MSPKIVQDPRLLRREIYNPNNFEVQIEMDLTYASYVLEAGITFLLENKKSKVRVPPQGRVVVPHGYIIVRGIHKNREMPAGTPIDMLEIFGKNIGKGFKNPSLPIYDHEWMKKGKL